MTTLSLQPSRRWTRERVLAVVASAIAHLAFLALMLAHLGSALPRDETPPMEVTLVAPWPEPAQRSAPSMRPSTHLTPAPTQPVETRPEPALVQPPAPAPVTTAAPGLGAVLRGRLGCDHASLVDLSPAERQLCQDRFAKAPGPGAAKPFDLSRGGAIVERSREPFLARKPHNGCVPNVDQKERSLLGVSRSDWSTGLKCAWSF